MMTTYQTMSMLLADKKQSIPYEKCNITEVLKYL